MDRLTKRNPDGSVSSTINCPDGCKYFTCSMEEGQLCYHECEADYMCKLADYEDIGTIEELKDELYSLRAAIDFYQAIGSVTECRKAVEKQIPKKPDYEADGYSDGELVYDYAKCPICGHDFEYGINDWECEYCSDCGQKLDWE